MKKKVIVLTGYYVPSIKGGGPIRSVKNLVDNLSDRIDFYIVAADRDLGDNKPFSDIKTDEWLHVGKAKVLYTNPSNLTWQKTANIINSIDYDVTYLNSFFSYKFSTVPILLSKIKRIPKKPVIMAPRGQFSPGALGLKSVKKKLYIKLAKALGLYKDITWHATADTEKKDIESIFGSTAIIKVANNLTADYRELQYHKEIKKSEGQLKIAFISRIHPKKNLKKAIEFLNYITGEIDFNIYGPIEDHVYWSECEGIIKSLKSNVKIAYKGIIQYENIIDIFKEHHVFLFPTLGENFGHVISEALIGGCPVIISDQTPWRNLERKQVGWDIKLTNENRFVQVLQHCVSLSNEEYRVLSLNAFKYGKNEANNELDIQRAYSLFDNVQISINSDFEIIHK